MTIISTGIVTLTTDFGLQEPYVGIMKGVIVSACPPARIIDITHEIRPGQVGAAGFWLGRAWRWFPDGTVHVAVVDPGVGTDREIVAIESGGHCFLSPDNGLAAELLRHLDHATTRTVAPETFAAIGAAPASNTFHGRDLFAPLAAALASGRLSPERVGPEKETLTPSPFAMPEAQGPDLIGQILVADRYGNLISNLPAASLAGRDRPCITLLDHTLELSRTYADAAQGTLLALVNSMGYIEIAVSGGSAARALNSPPGTAIRLGSG